MGALTNEEIERYIEKAHEEMVDTSLSPEMFMHFAEADIIKGGLTSMYLKGFRDGQQHHIKRQAEDLGEGFQTRESLNEESG